MGLCYKNHHHHTSNRFHRYSRGFSYDLLRAPQNKFLDIFTHHVQIISKPPHISGSLIEHVYIKKDLMEEFFTNIIVENISAGGMNKCG